MNIFDRLKDGFKAFQGETPDKEVTPPQNEQAWADSILFSLADFPKYDPDQLKQNKGAAIYQKMASTDDQVKAALQFKINAVISRDHFFEVGTDEEGNPIPEQQAMADYFEFALEQIKGSWKDILYNIMTALQNGYSMNEKNWDSIDYLGKAMWGYKTIKIKPHDSFTFVVDNYGNVQRIEQNLGGKQIVIAEDKIIHFVHQPDIDEQYGESDLRACYRNYWSKDIIQKFLNVHLERHASGFVTAKVAGTLTTTERTNLQNVVKNLSARSGVIAPDNVEFDFVQPSKTDAYERAIALNNTAISKSLLVPNLLGLSEQGKNGSRALGDTQLQAFFWVLDELAGRMDETINEQVIRDLAVFNFGTTDFPRYKSAPISDASKYELAKTWADLVQKGAVTHSETDEAHTRKLLDYPEKAEGEEPIEPEGDKDNSKENDNFIESLPDIHLKGMKKSIKKRYAESSWFKRINFQGIENQLDSRDEEFSEALADIMAQAKVSIDKQITSIVGDKSLGNIPFAKFKTVSIPSSVLSDYRKTSRIQMDKTMNEAVKEAKTELPKKFAEVRVGMDKIQADRYLASKSFKMTGVINDDVLKWVQQELENGIKYDKTLKATLEALEDNSNLAAALPRVDAAGRAVIIPARLETTARTNNSDAWNQGRMSFFGDPALKGFVEAYEYSAILDARTTEVCTHLDGKIYKDFNTNTPPNHFNCRSLLVPITVVDEWNQKQSRPATVEPQEGFK